MTSVFQGWFSLEHKHKHKHKHKWKQPWHKHKHEQKHKKNEPTNLSCAVFTSNALDISISILSTRKTENLAKADSNFDKRLSKPFEILLYWNKAKQFSLFQASTCASILNPTDKNGNFFFFLTTWPKTPKPQNPVKMKSLASVRVINNWKKVWNTCP